MPRFPLVQAAKRTYTSSFGPVCFGSLVVALIDTLIFLVRQSGRSSRFAAMIAECILGWFLNHSWSIILFLDCIRSWVEYFNVFAYVQVAIYGKGFCQAAKGRSVL